MPIFNEIYLFSYVMKMIRSYHNINLRLGFQYKMCVRPFTLFNDNSPKSYAENNTKCITDNNIWSREYRYARIGLHN